MLAWVLPDRQPAGEIVGLVLKSRKEDLEVKNPHGNPLDKGAQSIERPERKTGNGITEGTKEERKGAEKPSTISYERG